MLGLFRSVRKDLRSSPCLTPFRPRWSTCVTWSRASSSPRRKEGLAPDRQGGDQDDSSGIYFVTSPETPDLCRVRAGGRPALGPSVGPHDPAPGDIGYAAAGAAELAGGPGRPFLLNFDKMREAVAGSWTCRVDRARDELGFQPEAPLGERLRQTADWYRDNGWL